MPILTSSRAEVAPPQRGLMAHEIDEGVAYLRSLKQSSPLSAAAAAPARYSSTAGGDAGDQFKGAEKRRSPRYKCEGSAELREEGCDVRTWATFSDISLHGCYVEAQATYPANTQLHMKLDANGVRVETKGSVRVSYPYLGMGIAFADMSEENVARLRTLLATVSRTIIVRTRHGFFPSGQRSSGATASPHGSHGGHDRTLGVLCKPPDVDARRLRPHRPSKSGPHRQEMSAFDRLLHGLPSIRAALATRIDPFAMMKRHGTLSDYWHWRLHRIILGTRTPFPRRSSAWR